MKDVPLILFVGLAGPCNIQDPSIRDSPSQIYTFLPKKVSQKIDFPHQCRSFIFPMGIQFNYEQSHDIIIQYFNFPNESGKQFFGISANFKYPIDNKLQHKLVEQDILEEAIEKIVYSDHSIFMLFSEPIHQHFADFMTYYAKMLLNKQLHLEQIIEVLHGYIPTPNKFPLQISYGQLSQSLHQSNNNVHEINIQSINSYGHSIFPQAGLLYKNLSPQVIVDAIEALLQSRSVLLMTFNITLGSQLVYELLSTIFPFHYPYPFYSLLPQKYFPVLHTPIPIMGCTSKELLQGQTLNPDILLIDVDKSKIIPFYEFNLYGIKCRYCISRRALDKLQTQFYYIVQNDQDKDKYLWNTMNYDKSDVSYIPKTVQMKQLITTKKGFFKKEIQQELVSIQKHQKHSEQFQNEDDNPDLKEQSSISNFSKHVTMKQLFLPFFSTQILAYQIEVNERLSHFQALKELDLKNSAHITDSIDQKSINGQKKRATSLQEQLELIFKDQKKHENYVFSINDFNLPTANNEQRKNIFKEEDFQKNYGVNYCIKPPLPQIIKNLLLIVIEQNSNYFEQQMKNLLVKLYEDEQVEHIDRNYTLYPNPLTMILWKLSCEYEKKIQNDANNEDIIQELQEIIQQMPEHMDLFGASVQSVTPEMAEQIREHIKNTPVNLVPSSKNKKIDLPRLRTGITAVLLLLVQHYRKALTINVKKQGSQMISVINMKEHEKQEQPVQQIVIKQNSQKIVMHYSNKNEPQFVFRDVVEKFSELTHHHQLLSMDVSVQYNWTGSTSASCSGAKESCAYNPGQQMPYARIFDYRTFAAEAPSAFRQFIEYFCRTAIFQSFLETRLSDQVHTLGPSFFGLAKGNHYNPFINCSSQTTSFMGTNSVLTRDNLSSVFYLNKNPIETRSTTDDSSTEMTNTGLNYSLNASGRLEYQQMKQLENFDLADLMLRKIKPLTDGEANALIQNTSFQFYIQKQGMGSLGQRWNERVIQLYINQAPIFLTWRKNGEPEERYRGKLKICNSNLVEVPNANAYPSAYPVSVQGQYQDGKSKELERRLIFCFQTAAEQRLFLLITKHADMKQTLERIKTPAVLTYINKVRKNRMAAHGALQTRLEDINTDIIEWAILNSDVK